MVVASDCDLDRESRRWMLKPINLGWENGSKGVKRQSTVKRTLFCSTPSRSSALHSASFTPLWSTRICLT